MSEKKSEEPQSNPPSKSPNTEKDDGRTHITPASVFTKCIRSVVKAFDMSDTRLIFRALQYVHFLRTTSTPEELREMAMQLAGKGRVSYEIEAAFSHVSSASSDVPEQFDVEYDSSAQPIVDAFVWYLPLTIAVQNQQYSDAVKLLKEYKEWLKQENRRILDVFEAKAFSMFVFCSEKLGQVADIRSEVLSAYRTACLRHDEFSQAVLLNFLVRSFLKAKQYEQAQKMINNSSFPAAASNNQLIRHLYYSGKIHAIQLEYADAFAKLQQAARKAPSNTALGFRITVQKLITIVQLLMGDLPERVTFFARGMQKPLEAYLHLTQAVRVGDIRAFHRVLAQHESTFRADDTYSLIQRLPNSVIRTGLRAISKSYSRISFADIAEKLHLGSAEDAEFLCAKAIRDGVIDAELDHEACALRSKEESAIYATRNPQAAYHKRIAFCLDVYNSAVKAMRYPDDHKPKKPEPLQQPNEEEVAELMEEFEAEDGL